MSPCQRRFEICASWAPLSLNRVWAHATKCFDFASTCEANASGMKTWCRGGLWDPGTGHSLPVSFTVCAHHVISLAIVKGSCWSHGMGRAWSSCWSQENKCACRDKLIEGWCLTQKRQMLFIYLHSVRVEEANYMKVAPLHVTQQAVKIIWNTVLPMWSFILHTLWSSCNLPDTLRLWKAPVHPRDRPAAKLVGSLILADSVKVLQPLSIQKYPF